MARASWNRETSELDGEPRPRMTICWNRNSASHAFGDDVDVVDVDVGASARCEQNPASPSCFSNVFVNCASRISRTARSIRDHVFFTDASLESSTTPNERVVEPACNARNAVALIFRRDPFPTTVHASSPIVGGLFDAQLVTQNETPTRRRAPRRAGRPSRPRHVAPLRVKRKDQGWKPTFALKSRHAKNLSPDLFSHVSSELEAAGARLTFHTTNPRWVPASARPRWRRSRP